MTQNQKLISEVFTEVKSDGSVVGACPGAPTIEQWGLNSGGSTNTNSSNHRCIPLVAIKKDAVLTSLCRPESHLFYRLWAKISLC